MCSRWGDCGGGARRGNLPAGDHSNAGHHRQAKGKALTLNTRTAQNRHALRGSSERAPSAGFRRILGFAVQQRLSGCLPGWCLAKVVSMPSARRAFTAAPEGLCTL